MPVPLSLTMVAAGLLGDENPEPLAAAPAAAGGEPPDGVAAA